jgi:hypothetical protein
MKTMFLAAAHRLRHGLVATVWQVLSAAFCVLFGLAIIVNVQLSGDSVWFWYATLLHRGVRLYADLHLVLQPLFILETDAWMRLVGTHCIAYESLSLIHLAIFCVGMVLLLRESNWPDWQKAILLFGCFFALIRFGGYRFDDFHIVADSFYLYAMVFLFHIARAQTSRRRFGLAVVLGVLCGLAVTNRSTDGGLLMLATGACLLCVVRRQKLAAVLLFSVTALLIWLVIVHLTGDTLHDYVVNSVLKAGSAKGGTGNVLRGPLVALLDSFSRLYRAGKREILAMALLVLAGYLLQRFWKKDMRLVVLAEVVLALLLGLPYNSPGLWSDLLRGTIIGILSTFVQPVLYAAAVWVVFRALRARFKSGTSAWDPREAVLLVPLATLVSAALSQATGTSNSTNTMAFLFILVPVLIPVRGTGNWMSASFVAIVVLVGLAGVSIKLREPYTWGAMTNASLFENRQWYRHPLYGPMYIDRDLLQFTDTICRELGPLRQGPGHETELLSIPFPYTNYFCGITPWNNYVQTWYDTVTPATVMTLTKQLGTAPPQWILYQRQPATIEAHEAEYNHGQPSAHRYLDALLMQKIASGEWKLVEKQHYLAGDAWYLIETHP